MVRFSQSFWDKDPNGTVGYDTLIRHLKDGKKLFDTVSEFFKQRAKAEDDYGKSLIRLAQQANGSEEFATLGEAWNAVRKETEDVGLSHCELARKLDDIDRRIKTFRDEQKNERTKIDEKMKKLQKEKRTTYDNVIKAKRQYEQRCKEFMSVAESIDAISVYTPKEEEKLKNRRSRSKTAQENADQQYQSSVKSLEQAQDAWEFEMEVSCDRFQELEEQRIRFLRNELWLYSNVSSQSCVDDDAMFENIRLQLEKCEVYKDITAFIHSKQTGSERPAKLKYENYYHPSEADNSFVEMNLKQKMPSLPRNQQPKYTNLSPSEADLYARIATVEKSAITSPMTLKAAFDYSSQGDEELSLIKGDIVELFVYENSDWGRGRLQRSGKVGVFPIAFVEKA